ncbi:MAG: hypothetical protein WCV73_04955 [Patescibacteria group bacterium]|jgi:hypothetical protein
MRFFEKQPNSDPKPFKLGKKIKPERGGYFSETPIRSKKNPDTLVKRLKIEGEYVDETLDNYDVNTFKERYQKSLRLLETYLAEFLPKMQLVFGQDKDQKKTGYLLVQEIISTKIPKENHQATQQLNTLLIKIIEMWLATQKESDDKIGIIPELSNIGGNIMYGHTKNDQTDKFYVVDIYPLEYPNKRELIEMMNEFFSMNPEIDFTETKNKLRELEM